MCTPRSTSTARCAPLRADIAPTGQLDVGLKCVAGCCASFGKYREVRAPVACSAEQPARLLDAAPRLTEQPAYMMDAAPRSTTRPRGAPAPAGAAGLRGAVQGALGAPARPRSRVHSPPAPLFPSLHGRWRCWRATTSTTRSSTACRCAAQQQQQRRQGGWARDAPCLPVTEEQRPTACHAPAPAPQSDSMGLGKTFQSICWWVLGAAHVASGPCRAAAAFARMQVQLRGLALRGRCLLLGAHAPVPAPPATAACGCC